MTTADGGGSAASARVYGGGLLALAAWGTFRSILPDGIKTWWSTVLVLLALAATLAAIRAGAASARRAGEAAADGPWRWRLWALLPLALGVLYLQPQRVASDGVFYFAPLRSLVVDGDLDFANEYRVLGVPEGYFRPTATGRLPNHFSIGPALLWTPGYLVVHAAALVGAFRPTGFGYPYFTIVATTSALAGFLGLVWLYGLARRFVAPPVAWTATVLVGVGSFHLWYMLFEPSMAHAPAMAAVAAFVSLLLARPPGLRGGLLLGAAAGLVVLLRWQNAIFLAVAPALWLARAARRPGRRELAGAFAALCALVSLQLAFWKAIYGTFLLVPQGRGYVDPGSMELLSVLFSTRHGLFSWSPVLWLGAFGILGLLRRAPVLAASLVGAFLLSWLVNASVADWWAGASFGARRFDGSLVLFGLGLAVALDAAQAWIRRRPLLVATAGAAPLVLWNVLLVGAYTDGAVPRDAAVSFRQLAADAAELAYRPLGLPFAWPAAWWEALRGGFPPGVYDLVGARQGFRTVEIRMGDTDALFVGRGWSLPRRGGGRTFRLLPRGGASVFVTLAEATPYRLGLDAEPGRSVLVSWNGRPVGTVALDEGGRGRIALDPSRLVGGLNRLGLAPGDGRALRVYGLSLRRGAGGGSER